MEDYKKKYENAIEVVKKYRGTHILLTEDVIEEMFPELMESDDEMIRKDIVFYIAANHKDDGEKARWLYWLEKQGEHANFRNKIQIGDKVTRNEDGVLVNLSQLKRIAKPAEKQGKNNMGISESTKQELDDNLNKALEKETPESCNEFLEKQGEQKDVCINIKDNQELPNKEETEVSDEYQQGYRDGFKCGKEYVEKYPQEFNLQPMQLIQECEHENLIKERLTNAVNICYTEDGGKEAPFKEELIAYINKHCEWSKKDEEMYKEVLTDIIYAKNDLEAKECLGLSKRAMKAFNWFSKRYKLLRPQNRWKPSEEQMKALLYEVNAWDEDSINGQDLKSLYQDLKKL